MEERLQPFAEARNVINYLVANITTEQNEINSYIQKNTDVHCWNKLKHQLANFVHQVLQGYCLQEYALKANVVHDQITVNRYKLRNMDCLGDFNKYQTKCVYEEPFDFPVMTSESRAKLRYKSYKAMSRRI